MAILALLFSRQLPNGSHIFFFHIFGIYVFLLFTYETIETYGLAFLTHIIIAIGNGRDSNELLSLVMGMQMHKQIKASNIMNISYLLYAHPYLNYFHRPWHSIEMFRVHLRLEF